MKPVVVYEAVCVRNTGWNINIYFEDTTFLAPRVYTSQHRLKNTWNIAHMGKES